MHTQSLQICDDRPMTLELSTDMSHLQAGAFSYPFSSTIQTFFQEAIIKLPRKHTMLAQCLPKVYWATYVIQRCRNVAAMFQIFNRLLVEWFMVVVLILLLFCCILGGCYVFNRRGILPNILNVTLLARSGLLDILTLHKHSLAVL